MKKKACKKGYGCGKSCISYKKACRVAFPEGVSVSLSEGREIVRGKPKAPAPARANYVEGLTKDYSHREEVEKDDWLTGDYISYNLASTEVEFGDSWGLDKNVTDRLDKEWNGKTLEISWFTGGKIQNPPSQVEVAVEAKSMWEKKVLPSLGEGTLLANAPIGGVGGAREAAYRRRGFGYMGAGEIYQYAIVKNGKLEPINPFKPDVAAYTTMKKRRLSEDKFEYWNEDS